jgi:hypothetical protein
MTYARGDYNSYWRVFTMAKFRKNSAGYDTGARRIRRRLFGKCGRKCIQLKAVPKEENGVNFLLIYDKELGSKAKCIRTAGFQTQCLQFV